MSGGELEGVVTGFLQHPVHLRTLHLDQTLSTSDTGHSPINLATLRNAVINAIHAAGYLHVPEGRRDHTRPTEALHLHGLL